MGVYIDTFAVWESNLVGAPWYSAPFKLVLMLVLLAVVLAVMAVEVEFGPLRVDLRRELSKRDPEVT
jgi:F0F1-type ATP synthase assembly protein I